MTFPGKFFTFEGIDGSGKSTQLRLLSSELRVKGFDVVTTCEPGGTPLGRRLREAFLETEESVDPLAELLLFAADRAQHVNFLIKPEIAAGKIVLSDRYADATIAYQGAGRGFDSKIISSVVDLATGGLKPDLTLFFDLPVEQALLRTNSREHHEAKPNRMDSESFEFYSKVRKRYLKIEKDEPKRFRVINATASVEEIHLNVMEVVSQFLEAIK